MMEVRVRRVTRAHRTYRQDVAGRAWANGFLSFRSSGRECGLGVTGVPFLGAEWLGDLSGRRSKEMSDASGFEFQGRAARDHGALDLICTGYSVRTSVVSLDLWCEVRDEESGERGSLEGKMRCAVVERGTGRWWPFNPAA